MATAQDVFDKAMGLIDEVNQTTGLPDAANTAEYKSRTLLILNVLRGELYPYSDTYVSNTNGVRPIVGTIDNFTDDIGLDDYICDTLLPYGLAAHLLLDENPTSAAFFQQRYEELRNKLARGLPVVSEDIVDVYFGNNGSYEYDWMARW